MWNTVSQAGFDGGVLSRTYEDLHPQPDAYEVRWNGSIAAQQQKAEQRSAPDVTRNTSQEELQAQVARRAQIQAAIFDAITRARAPRSFTELMRVTNVGRDALQGTLTRLAGQGKLSTFLELRSLKGKQKAWIRVYTIPVVREDAA